MSETKTTRREFLKIAALAVAAPLAASQTAVAVAAEPVVKPLLVAETVAAPTTAAAPCPVMGGPISLRNLIADNILQGMYPEQYAQAVGS